MQVMRSGEVEEKSCKLAELEVQASEMKNMYQELAEQQSDLAGRVHSFELQSRVTREREKRISNAKGKIRMRSSKCFLTLTSRPFRSVCLLLR